MSEVKKNSVLEKVEVTEAVSEGKAMAKVDGMVVFINNAVPGDVADLKITKVKSNYAEASAVYIHRPSEHRAVPFCQHFGVCGGCQWQHLDYSMQLFFKHKQVEDVFQRMAQLEIPMVMPTVGSSKTQYYRNRLDFTFSDRAWLTKQEMEEGKTDKEDSLGFHVPRRFDKILDIKKCWLQEDLSNAIRLAAKEIAVRHGLSFYNAYS
jgi:23S rRNA (uracil1939-C5)-methyltransferase